ncbi:MAG: hypothetical protein DWQ47_08755 [Acidobacteria bacterium]|nr:MAG: hypothetical protein DWQ32_16855 [Acidobacteriota bacterium]REJ99005.1 MAG: hypothetical protein DWQ38_13125 [Acidobacteriota bacterium]REK16275.1 MAG: hypothetical protein DWQ43_04565 [Acidobacteriota bacterium]REK43956.1 MAG: hypothetical protein DWQ47_08755 [Acidobacteriota bacterium]
MNQSFTAVPFKTESGLSEINGLAKFSSAGVVLEFESKLLGMFKGQVKEIRVPLDEILDVKFKKGLFKIGAGVELRLRNFAKMSELPTESGRFKLKVRRQDFELAKDAAERLIKDLEDYRAGLPPVQTPVSSLFENTTDLDTKELED